MSRAYAAGVLLLGAWLLSAHFGAALAPGLAAAALLAALALSAVGLGRLLLRPLDLPGLGQAERSLVGCTLGLGALSQGLFALGAAGLLRPAPARVLLAACGAAGLAVEWRGVLASFRALRRLAGEAPRASCAALALAGAALWAACVPPHQYDALVYHLALPAAYLKTGSLRPLEHLLYSHFPQNGEMLFALALAFGSDLLAQMTSWLCFALSLLWVLAWSRPRLPVPAAWAACLLAASHTALLLLASTAYVEPLATLWITASVLCLCRHAEAGGREGRGWLLLSAVFSGLGVGTKYYAGICPAVLGAALAWRCVRCRPAERGGSSLDAALFAAVACAVAAPWLVKNWILIGDPFFPFLHRLFPIRGEWGAQAASGYFAMLGEYGHAPGSFLKDLVFFPYMAASGSLRFGGGMDALGDLGWGLLLSLLPAAAWAARRRPAASLPLLYCAAHGAVWFCTGVVLRFLVPLVPLLSIGAGLGLHALGSRLGRLPRAALGLGVAAMALLNLGLFLWVHALFGSHETLLGLRGRQDYLSSRLDYYPCARAADSLGENARILVAGEQRGYYLDRPYAATTLMAPNRFVAWADASPSPAVLAARLRAEGGFTHLLLVPREERRLQGSGTFSFTERGFSNWRALSVGHPARPVFAAGGCSLLELPAPGP